MIKNTMLNISGNYEILKKESQQLGSSLTYVSTVIEDLLRAFCKVFYLRFFVSSDQWKRQCRKNFTGNDSYKSFFVFTLVFLSLKPKTKKSVEWLVTKKILFYLQRVALYFKVMPNSIDFYKGSCYFLFLFVL